MGKIPPSTTPKKPKKTYTNAQVKNKKRLDAIDRNTRITKLGREGNWKGMLAIHHKEKRNFNHVNYAMTMSQLGRIRSIDRREPMFNTFLEDLAIQLNNRDPTWMKARQISNILHATGKMRLQGVPAKRIVQFVKNQNNARRFVQEADPQAIAITVWAFAEMESKAPNVFSEIEKRAEWLIAEADAQAVANIALACAKLNVPSPNVFSEIDKRARSLFSGGNPQAVVNTAWACATLGVPLPKLFSEIERRVDWLVEKGNPQAVAILAWSFATLGVHSPTFFSSLDQRAEWLIEEGEPQAIANTAWSFATVGYEEATKFFSCLDANIDKILSFRNEQIIVNISYALLILDLGRKHKRSLLALWDVVLSMNPSKFSEEFLIQLAWVEALARADGINLQEPSPKLRERMEIVTYSDRPSEYQKEEVSAVLDEIGFDHERELSPLSDFNIRGMLSIDFGCRERRIAIEYDGPGHYLRVLESGKVSRVESGLTKAKRRFLEKRGWKVVNVNHQDWIEAERQGNCKEWLRRKLSEDAGVVDLLGDAEETTIGLSEEVGVGKSDSTGVGDSQSDAEQTAIGLSDGVGVGISDDAGVGKLVRPKPWLVGRSRRRHMKRSRCQRVTTR